MILPFLVTSNKAQIFCFRLSSLFAISATPVGFQMFKMFESMRPGYIKCQISSAFMIIYDISYFYILTPISDPLCERLDTI